jgi:hypothetical protein
VFENRVLRRIFGPKRDEVSGEWRKLHNVDLHYLYSSPDIVRQIKSRRIRWAGHVARMGEERKVYKVLVGKRNEKRPLGRPRHRWEDGIRMNLGDIGWGGSGLDSIGSGQGPVADCCECGDERSGSCTTELVLCQVSVCAGIKRASENIMGTANCLRFKVLMSVKMSRGRKDEIFAY